MKINIHNKLILVFALTLITVSAMLSIFYFSFEKQIQFILIKYKADNYGIESLTPSEQLEAHRFLSRINGENTPNHAEQSALELFKNANQTPKKQRGTLENIRRLQNILPIAIDSNTALINVTIDGNTLSYTFKVDEIGAVNFETDGFNRFVAEHLCKSAIIQKAHHEGFNAKLTYFHNDKKLSEFYTSSESCRDYQ